MKNLLKKIYFIFGNDKFRIGLFLVLIFLSVFSIFIFNPKIEGDAVSYIQSIQVLRTNNLPTGFIPNRIITTYFGLTSIMLVDIVFNNLLISWLALNSLFYIAMGMFFYSLLLKIVDNRRTAFLGTLFLITNYSAIVFSSHYFMDVGGWAFYVASLYFSFKYLETKEDKWIWISALVVGLGSLFKEYAFLAYVVIFGLIVFTEWKQWRKVILKIFLTGLLAFVPMVIINFYSFYTYHYTYLSWYSAQNVYAYQNKFIEYIKSFGSLYNLGWSIFLGGLYIFLKRFKETPKNPKLLFIWLVCLSSLVVFFWPVVTRVLFITMPAIILISSLFIKKIDKKWYVIIPLLFSYVLATYFMDSFILNFVNLPF